MQTKIWYVPQVKSVKFAKKHVHHKLTNINGKSKFMAILERIKKNVIKFTKIIWDNMLTRKYILINAFISISLNCSVIISRINTSILVFAET